MIERIILGSKISFFAVLKSYGQVFSDVSPASLDILIALPYPQKRN
jgi:hypothetical protein